ncbi:hypothetical protein RN001_008484 [Aquatica leii]|uniref:Timeless n=1 Tax=Aquatica leii TaxID=1421715 RepID=A0AAN7QJ14_9COLE|nr:hypothetical protein RN001_008484 [Aquatica leii]
MAWVITSPQIHDTFASLGSRQGDLYVVNKSCLSNLEEILKNLILEDRTLRTYRRAIGFGENIRKDLIPLLINVKNSTTIEDATKIIDATVKILLNLTVPVECLLSLEQQSRTDVGRHTIFELNRLLITSKEAFTDNRSTKAVVDYIKYVVEKGSNLSGEQCNSIHNCLLLLRNILHIPENRIFISNFPLAHASMQNHIIWNLFTQSIDKILIYLMTCPQKTYWGVTMVQLIALMYKDQHVGTLQKLLTLWFEASLSESSENESNTSPQNEGSGESSPLVTSDPTSDSSDNGGKRIDRAKTITLSERHKNNTDDVCNRMAEVVRATQNKSLGIKKERSFEIDSSCSGDRKQSIDSGVYMESTKKYSCITFQNELSDCGYVTQVENKGESISTSSNDDDQPTEKPVHHFQKVRHCNAKNRTINILEKKEMRRKKLVKRSKTNIINMKGLMHHIPTDEDITNVLKEFTVDLLLKAYGTLVQDLYMQLLTNIHLSMDTSYFFWLVTYFLKFAAQLELDWEFISPVLSYDIISYLVFQGVWLFEELQISHRSSNIDLKPTLRRLHLVVTAIREFMQTFETYEKVMHISDEDRNSLMTLQIQMCEMEELKNLFLLLLRQYDAAFHSKQYLQDLIVTNHSYLLLLDKMLKNKAANVNIEEHLKEFATVEYMRQYGILLEDFQENGEYVNNCIFTMMHHTAGDLENITSLFQPRILKTFSQIWETDFEICDDWSDLIEYVIHSFISISKGDQHIFSPLSCNTPATKCAAISATNQMENTHFELAKNQTLNISEKSFTDCIIDSVISSTTPDSTIFFSNDIDVLKQHLIKNNKQKHLLWLQKSVLEACFAKLIVAENEISQQKKQSSQPVFYYSTLLHLPIPLVPWTSEQWTILKYQPFILLLHKIGFILPGDIGKVFVRIPNFWTIDFLFNIAEQLGPIDNEILKFDLDLLRRTKKIVSNTKIVVTQSYYAKDGNFLTHAPSIVRYTPCPNSMEWFSTVLQSKVAPLVDPNLNLFGTTQLSINIPEIATICDTPPPELTITQHALDQNKTEQQTVTELDCSALPGVEETEYNSMCETASATSDLTRMCVSDEEEKIATP